jgi:hypothetical protein
MAGSGCGNASGPATNTADTKAASNIDSGQNADLTGYSLATPTDAYRTAFEARKKCDIPVLKRVMDRKMLEAMTVRGEANEKGRQTLDQVLKDLCDLPQAPNAEDIKDEKIVGDEATVKYKDEKGTYRLMDLVRENGEWKITMPRGNNELPALK